MDTLAEQKKRLRETVIYKRNKLNNEEVKLKSSVIINKLLRMPGFDSARLIMCYVNFGNEVATSEFIDFCLNSGKKIAVPLVTNLNGIKSMHACEINNITADLEKGNFGILEPKEDRPVPAESIDFAVIPGVAFDACLNRLGFGKGFYDRFLPQLKKACPKVGIAFEAQIVDSVPVSEYDIKMDMVVTEERTFSLGR